VKRESRKASLRCAIYTRVSTENGLEQEFNSLDNQREASEAYIRSQAHEGWKLIRDRYDDGGFSGGSMDRPALAKRPLLRFGRLDDVVVVGMGSEWRGVAVADRIEPKPIAPPPKDDALVMVIVAVAPHGVAPPELPVVVVVDRKSHAVSSDHVDPIRFG
jgi:Resolvase, N terminal domain